MTDADFENDPHVAPNRRTALRRLAVAGTVAWVTPAVLASPAAAATVSDPGEGPSSGDTVTFVSQPNLPVPPRSGTTVRDDIVVEHGGNTADLDVYVRLTNNPPEDLTITLSHVDSGTSMSLLVNPPCGATKSIDATFDDAAASPATCNASAPAISGLVQPVGSLGSFNAEALSGTWRLTVTDSANGGGEGTLEEWKLIFTLA